jgi:amino acid adenylation domain-containing protein
VDQAFVDQPNGPGATIAPALQQPGSWTSTTARIAAAAAAHPEAVALRAGGQSMSYAALIGAASALAGELIERGAGRDTVVGVCLPRSFAHVVAFLGVLQAGAAFLPIDPGWPLPRIRAVLDDAGAAVAIASGGLAPSLASETRSVLSRDADGPPSSPSVAPSFVSPPSAAAADPDQLAYLIYTSGSTGEPKGVEIVHRNLANLVDWHIEAFGVGPADRMSCMAGLSFDAVIWELLPALSAGATVHLVPDDVRRSAAELQGWLIEQQITVAFVPTPLAETLVAAEWPDAALRLLLTGGDTLHVWPRADLPFAVVNNYGPSECAVVATSGPVAPGERDGLPSIGRPIRQCRIHILDEDGEPVPAGAIGEIHIGGDNVGRGYRNRPALTAEKFVTRVVGGAARAERLYRTGDLGRWTADGAIEFHGRRDDQLKIRGYRVEPDEVSAVLNRHPLVGQSAVVAQGSGSDRRLAAYIVPKTQAVPRAGELRDFVASALPAYMVPELFVRVDAIPLTANGKTDRNALPVPMPANALPGVPFRAPADGAESRIAAMVEQLLGIHGVGADDNFFLLGGHSLLGTQLVLRLRQAFGVELKLRDLFEAQTIGQLARTVEREVTRMVMAMDEDEIRERLVP